MRDLPGTLPAEALAALAAEARATGNWLALAHVAARAPSPRHAELRAEVLSGVDHITERAACLTVLVRALPDMSLADDVADTLDAILALDYPGSIAEALEELIPALAGDVLRETVARWLALLDSDRVHVSPIAIARSLCSVAAASPQIAPLLVERLPASLATTRAIALALLTPHLPQPMRRDIAARAFQLASERRELDGETAFELARVAEYLDGTQVERLRTVARAESGYWRGGTLAGLARVLPAAASVALVDQVIESIATAGEWRDREHIAEQAAPFLPADRLLEAARATTRADDDRERFGAVLDMIDHLDDATRTDVLRQLLDVAAGSSESTRAEDLTQIASLLPESLLERATGIARGVGSPRLRVRALGALVSRRPALLAEADAAVHEVEDAAEKGHALARLIRCRKPEGQHEAIAVLLPLLDAEKHDETRAESIAAILPFAGAAAASMAHDAVVRYRHHGAAMRFLVPHLGIEPLREYADHLQWIDAYNALAALPELMVRLCRTGYPAEAWTRLKSIERDDAPARARAVAAMAPLMRVSDLSEAPAWLAALDNHYASEPALVEVLEALAAAGHGQHARELAGAMTDPMRHAAALAAIARHSNDARPLVDQAVAIVESLPYAETRWLTVRKLAAALATLDPTDIPPLLARLLASLCQTLRLNFVPELNVLAPAFARAGGPDAVAALRRVVQQCAVWWP